MGLLNELSMKSVTKQSVDRWPKKTFTAVTAGMTSRFTIMNLLFGEWKPSSFSSSKVKCEDFSRLISFNIKRGLLDFSFWTQNNLSNQDMSVLGLKYIFLLFVRV